MKNARRLFMIMFILVLLGLTACNTDEESAATENSETDGHTTTTATTDASPPTDETNYIIIEGDPNAPLPEIHEIILPADGETIRYPDGFVIYQDEEGRTLTALEAYREGANLYFNVEDSAYYFDLAMTMLTAQEEVFVSLNRVDDETTSFDYVICTVDHLKEEYRTATINCAVRDIAGRLGDEYSHEKNYFYVDSLSSETHEKGLG